MGVVRREARGAVRPDWLPIACACASACAMFAALAGGAATAQDYGAVAPGHFTARNPVTLLTAKSFARPPPNDRPWVRWNFPPTSARDEELIAELDDMAHAGIAGVEIGQGGPPTRAQLEAILTEANRRGMTVSLKAGPGAPYDYPPSSDLVRKTLNARQITIASGETYRGRLPEAKGTLVAVLAYHVVGMEANRQLTLDRSSVHDLTGLLTDVDKAGFFGRSTTGTLDWTAPTTEGGGEWAVVVVRAVAYAPMPEVMSLAGTRQLIAGYESYWSPRIKALLRANHGDIFVDSHSNDPWALPQELWSSNLADAFSHRFGYDLIPNLPAVFDRSNSNQSALDTSFFYNFSDGSAARIRNDHNQLRSDLFVQNRIKPFEQWLHSYGLQLRLQPEDAPPTASGDQIQIAAALDRPEHESLAGGDQVDLYRPIASANHMTGKVWYSTECCAARSLAYAQTFQDMIIRMNKEFAGGVNRPVYHVYSYRDGLDQSWPGYNLFGKTSFSNAWNRSQPVWGDAPTVNAYFARTHQVLTQGVAKVDIAVYMQNYSFPQPWGEKFAPPPGYTGPTFSDKAQGSGQEPEVWGIDNTRYWKDLGLQSSGYTWDYVNPTLLALPNAMVRSRRLAPRGPAYKALIYDATQGPVTNAARGALDLGAARRILGFARAGLPVIIVGAPPTHTPGIDSSSNRALLRVMRRLLRAKSVHQVPDEAAVPSLLARLGIRPAVQPNAPSTLLSQRRHDGARGIDYYYLYNQGIDQVPPSLPGEFGGTPDNMFEEPAACRFSGSGRNPCTKSGQPVNMQVTLEGVGTPLRLDPWTGRITPLVAFQQHAGTVTVRVQLDADDSAIIALAAKPKDLGSTRPRISVRSTDADAATWIDEALTLRGQVGRTYKTVLSNGRSLETILSAAQPAIDLTNEPWNISAEDWRPTKPYGSVGSDAPETSRKHVDLSLDRLRPWPDIPALKDASGIGVYTNTFTLPATWDDASEGATLSLGQVTDSFAVTINGHPIDFDQISATADIGPFLKAGANRLTVRVATTLNNRLAALDPQVEKRGLIQNYGLVGPVVITPYRQRAVWPVGR